MHFTLVTAPTITEFRTPQEIASPAVQRAALQPQLGVLSVAAVLQQWGDTPHLLDSNAEYLAFARDAEDIDAFAYHLAERAVRTNADVYGFSTLCSTFPLTLRTARALKQLRPYATVLLGGPQASVVDQAVVETFPCVDFILRGEVEHSLPIYLHELTGDSRFDRVPGLTFLDGRQVCRTPNAPVIEDLDALPAPAWHLSRYLQGATTASIELGRGCPFACTFCSTNDFFRRRFRLRSPERVLAEMRSLADTYGIRHFELVHDMFTVDRKRVAAFCRAMRDAGDRFTWDCSARTDCVDEELLAEMAAGGCRGVFFGIESGSTRMQRIIDKDLDPAKAEAMLAACEQLGIRTTASLITGFPEETWQDVRDTLRIYTRSARCGLSHPQINLLAPLAGTPLHTRNADKLQLDEYTSDMSHQGLSQASEDLDLILRFPQIFPNFYMVPSPDLDRAVLSELRDFLGMAVAHHRWLLCAVAQFTDLLDFARAWMERRLTLTGPLSTGDLRRYYASPTVRREFLDFIASCDMETDPVVSTLLAAGRAVLRGSTEVIALGFDLAALTGAITLGTPPVPEPCLYAARPEADGTFRLHRITPFLADVLRNLEDSDALVAHLRAEFGYDDTRDVSSLTERVLGRLREEGWFRGSEVPAAVS